MISMNGNYSGYVGRRDAPTPIGRAFASATTTARNWVLSGLAAGREFLFALEPGQFETLDMPEFRSSPAVERCAAIAAAGTVARADGAAPRTYHAVVMETGGPGEQLSWSLASRPTF